MTTRLPSLRLLPPASVDAASRKPEVGRVLEELEAIGRSSCEWLLRCPARPLSWVVVEFGDESVFDGPVCGECLGRCFEYLTELASGGDYVRFVTVRLLPEPLAVP